MIPVAVAGGTGDLGRLIVAQLTKSSKYQIHIISRNQSTAKGPGQPSVIACDYSSEEALLDIFNERRIEIVLCVFSLHHQATSNAQTLLIRAAERAPTVKRFMPSEFNVDYDLDDDILPYPDKKYHRDARRALEQTTTLEYTYVYSGMFMDYFGIPNIESPLRELGLFIDPQNNISVVPDDGEAVMAMTLTTDVARYVSLALGLDVWPRVMTTAVSSLTINQLVRLTEDALGCSVRVVFQPVSALKAHQNLLLPRNQALAKRFPARFPQGEEQVRALIADLEASVALGAFDFTKITDSLNLAEKFNGKTESPTHIEDLVDIAWARRQQE